MINFENLKALIPEDLQDVLSSIYYETVQSKENLKVCFVGAFSSGKSSLINMLIDRNLLPVALEETTALPTFIEYGSDWQMYLVMSDSSIRPINELEFKEYTVNAPEGATYTAVYIPQEWLKDITIVDLPGLGSTSPSRREYTISQIRNADAIVYLLQPRGPSLEDLETISLIKRYGKRLHVVVAHWDEVEKSIKSGEKEPDLRSWESEIEQQTQYKVRIHKASKYGHGREELMSFFKRIKDDTVQIREQRFRAEAIPILENAIGQNISAQEVLNKETQEDINAAHQELLKNKDELIKLKSSLYDKKNADISKLNDAIDEKIKHIKTNLQNNLENLCIEYEENLENMPFDDFLKEGANHLRLSLLETANTLSDLSKSYGDLQLPEAKINELNIRLPQPEVVDVSDFMDISTYTQIQEMLAKEEEIIESAKKKLAQLQNISAEEINELSKQIQELVTNRQKIQSMPLPKIIQQTENQTKKTIFKVLGGILDIALIFVNPAFVGTKIASLLGKGAKVASAAKKTTEILQTAQRVRKGVDVLFKDSNQKQEDQQSGQDKTSSETVVKVLDKIGWLEKLSFEYWFERLAGGFEGVAVTDPVALAEQQEALGQINQQIELAKKEQNALIEKQYKKELTELELQQSLKKQAQLKQTINELIAKANEMKSQAEEEAMRRHKELVLLQIQKAKQHWLRNYDQQVRPMKDLLIKRCRNYWDDYVEQIVADRVEQVKELTDKLMATPESKKKIIEDLKNKLTSMQKALELIKVGY